VLEEVLEQQKLLSDQLAAELHAVSYHHSLDCHVSDVDATDLHKEVTVWCIEAGLALRINMSNLHTCEAVWNCWLPWTFGQVGSAEYCFLNVCNGWWRIHTGLAQALCCLTVGLQSNPAGPAVLAAGEACVQGVGAAEARTPHQTLPV